MDEALTMAVTLLGRTGDAFEAAVAAVRELQPTPSLIDGQWSSLPDLERQILELGACRTGAADLVLVPADWLPRLAEGGDLTPLDALLADSPPEGWPSAWPAAFTDVVSFDSGTGSAAVWGLPFHDGPQLLIYRRDLYESESEQRAYFEATGAALVPARTWHEFRQQARWFTRPDEGLYGTVFAGEPDGHGNVYDFVTQLRRFGGEVLEAGGREPAFHRRAGRAALDWLRRVCVVDGSVDPAARHWDSVASGHAFAAGNVALMVNWAGYTVLAESESSRVRGRVGATVAPTDAEGRPTITVNAFWALAVAAGSRRVDEAWRFVCDAASAAGDLATTMAGASGTRTSTWNDPAVLTRIPAIGCFEEAHRHSKPMPMVPALPAIVAALNELVDAVVQRGEPAARCLRDAADRVREALDARELATTRETR